jgi:hypothetical protein
MAKSVLVTGSVFSWDLVSEDEVLSGGNRCPLVNKKHIPKYPEFP